MDGGAFIARGTAATLLGNLGRLSRPLALALVTRRFGLPAVGGALLVSACVDIAACLGGLGLDKGLQRWLPQTAARDQPRVVVGALLAALGASVVAGVVLWLAAGRLLPSAPFDITAARLALALLPAGALVPSIALNAVRGRKQILSFVWGRSVIAPGAFLLASVTLGLLTRRPEALLAAEAASAAALAAYAAMALHRTFGLAALRSAISRQAFLVIGPLLRFSLPLGVADALGLALQRMDVVALGALGWPPAILGAYAVAREIVTSLSKIRQGFDQVVAPLAAELAVARRDEELRVAAVLSLRWSAALAIPLALVMMIFAPWTLTLFGVHAPTVTVAFVVLVVGRLVDASTGPTSVLLAMVSRPRLVLANAVFGVATAVLGHMILTPRLGALGAALSTTAGLLASNSLCIFLLARVAALRPIDRSLVPLLGLGAGLALALGATRALSGGEMAVGGVALVALSTLGYLGLARRLGMLPTRQRHRTPIRVSPPANDNNLLPCASRLPHEVNHASLR
ncbi:MAG TPA: polysaccharide biosynthesis C-terminal domain-containing protein [Polyangia bacterium]